MIVSGLSIVQVHLIWLYWTDDYLSPSTLSIDIRSIYYITNKDATSKKLKAKKKQKSLSKDTAVTIFAQ
jgi:hypothetical protein